MLTALPPPSATYTDTGKCYECNGCLVYHTPVPNTPHIGDCMTAAVQTGSSSFAIRGISDCFLPSGHDTPITKPQVQCKGGNGSDVHQITVLFGVLLVIAQ
jgi:hypothetical protein